MFSLLKDYSSVAEKAAMYPLSTIPPENAQLVPDNFDGRKVWTIYMRPPAQLRNIPSFSVVAKDVLNDRFALLSGGQIQFDLDHFEILSCSDTPPQTAHEETSPSSTFLKEFSQLSTSGYSIYDSWEFIYSKGLSQLNCFSYNKLKSLNYETPDTLQYQEKIKLYGFQCVNLHGQERTRCLVDFQGIPIAKHLFLSSAIYNVTNEGMSLDEKINAIKYDLCKWGPVAAGFVLYENFVNAYNGRTVYTKPSGRALGGHYVSIIGWKGNEWICRNSWGSDWGLLGYFRIKMGIPELQLENNVSAVFPFLPYGVDKLGKVSGLLDGQSVSLTDMKVINPKLFQARNKLQFNEQLFYSDETVDLISKGKLYGRMTPLIPNPKLLPNPIKFWVMDIQNYTFVTLEENQNVAPVTTLSSDIMDIITIWVMVVVCIMVFVISYYKYKV